VLDRTEKRNAIDLEVAEGLFQTVRALRFAVASVIAIAFIKVSFVGVHFMDLRNAPWGLH